MRAPADNDSAHGPAFPVAATDRLISLDILRGLALFGVMAINVVFEFRVSIFRQFLPARDAPEAGTAFFDTSISPKLITLLWTLFGDSPLNRSLQDVLDRTFSMKAFALFSLLFGVGLAMQFDRIAPHRRAILLLRRLLVLLAIGLLHLTLLWNGDILTEYALAGLVVLPFLFAPAWLIGAGCFAFLGLYFSGWLMQLMPLPGKAWILSHVADADHVYATGSFAQVLAFRLAEIGAIAPLHLWIFPRTLGLFLLGIVIWRYGALRHARDHRADFVLAALAALVMTIDAGPALATVTLALAYGTLILAVANTALGLHLLGWAAPVGRMAFTNYLMQSAIFSLAFYGYGFGLFGRISVALALAIGIVVYALQAIASRWWLAYFRFGPVEWLWRSLMYGRRQPMRIAS